MSGGPPGLSGFIFVVIAFGVIFVVLRRILDGGKSSRQAGKASRPFEAQSTPTSVQTPEQLNARLNRLVARNASAATAPPKSPPPTAAGGRDQPIVPIRDEAILFRQHIPPRIDAFSYWGGVPLVPQDFTWPSFTTPDGSERALHFIFQIECAEIADASRLGLPESGLLYFFVDLEWGTFWECRVLYIEGDPRLFAPATVPATLPHAYCEREGWPGVQRDDDWPHLLPRWSFDPILVSGSDMPPPADEDEEEERAFWPGTINLPEELARIEGTIVESNYYQNRYGDDKKLVRPFANFPHDWGAVRIAMNEIARQSNQGHMTRFVKRGDMSQADCDAFMAALQASIDEWTARADNADPTAPLIAAESDASWQIFLEFQQVAHFALSDAVNQSLDATLSTNPDPASVLPEEALALTRSRHAIASKGAHGLHIIGPDHILGPPSYVQGDAAERLGEWRLLFEMSSRDQIGHLFAEGVYQFWMRPEDLANRRFDRVQLNGSAY